MVWLFLKMMFMGQLFLALIMNLALFGQPYETQTYTVLDTIEGVEIRYYPASVHVKTTSFQGDSRNFSKLFSYISKGNQSDIKIAMTTPVYMEQNDTVQEMSFVLPKKYLAVTPPQPLQNDVRICDVPAGYFAALRFGGYASASKIDRYATSLNRILKNHNMIAKGVLKTLVYDSPFSFFNRRNEVVFEIDPQSLPSDIVTKQP